MPKRCSSCGRVRNIHYFYKRENGSKDGYWGSCKDCEYERRNHYRYGPCEECGERFYNVNYTLCRKCRKKKKVKPMQQMDFKVCNICTFLEDCQKMVKKTGPEYWDWMPYCFVSSKYHSAYVKEYAP